MADNISVNEKVNLLWRNHARPHDTSDADSDDTEEQTHARWKTWQKKLSSKEVIFNLNESAILIKPTENCYSRLYPKHTSAEEKEDELLFRGIILNFIEANKGVPLLNFFDSAMIWAQEKHKLPAVSGDAFAMTGFQLFCATNTSAIMNREKIRPKDKTFLIIQDATKTVLDFLKDAVQRATGDMHLIGSIHEGLRRWSRADVLKIDYCMLFETLPDGRYHVDPTTQLQHVYKYCRRQTAPGIANVILCIMRVFKMKQWDEGTLEYFLTTLLNAEGLTCVKATSIVINQVKSDLEDSACQMVKPDLLYFGKEEEDTSKKENEDICDALLSDLDDSKTVCICFPFELKSDTKSYNQENLKPCKDYVYVKPEEAFEYSESTETTGALCHLHARGDTKDLLLKLRVDHLWQMIIQMYAVMLNSNIFDISEKTTTILQGGILTINKESIMVVLAMDKDVFLGIQKFTSAAKTYNSLSRTAYMARIYILSDVFSSIDIMELSAYCHHHLCGAFDVNELV